MKRIFFICVCVWALGVACYVIFSESVGAVSGWSTGVNSIVSRNSITSATDYSLNCSGDFLKIEIHQQGVVSGACVYGGGNKLRVAKYLFDGVTQYAVSLPNKEIFYELKGVCAAKDCVYSDTTDTLVAYTLSSSSSDFLIYKNFGHDIIKAEDRRSNKIYYQFKQGVNPDFVLDGKNDVNRIVSAVFSNNGQWLVTQTSRYGMIRINTQTLLARQVFAPSDEYSAGSTILYKMAISNDGASVAVIGLEYQPFILTVSSLCGRDISLGIVGMFDEYTNKCAVSPLTSIIESVGYTSWGILRFNIAGNRLTISRPLTESITERLIIEPTATNSSIDNQELYIALGDSFTSGEGEIDDTFYTAESNMPPNTCHVSVRSYPLLVARNWAIQGKNVACSGARSDEILTAPSGSYSAADVQTALENFQPGVVAQLDFIEQYQPSVVSIGIGGNDAGLVGKLKACVSIGTCEWASSPSKRLATAKEIGSVYSKITKVIDAVKKQSPSSRIVVVGYPLVIDSTDAARCDLISETLLNRSERIFINESIRYLNRVLWAAATAARVNYANIEGSFFEHTLCGQSGSEAMNGLRFGDDIAPFEFFAQFRAFGSESYHPTPLGHQRVAETFLSYFDTSNLQVFCQKCSVLDEVPAPSAYWDSQGDDPVIDQVEKPFMTHSVLSTGQKTSITLDMFTFAPNTELKVALHSTPIHLGNVTSDAYGGLSIQLSIPPETTTGYHVLHITGQGPEGAPLDVYQTVALIDADKPTQQIVGGGEQPMVPTESNRSDIVSFLRLASVDTKTPMYLSATTEDLSASNTAEKAVKGLNLSPAGQLKHSGLAANSKNDTHLVHLFFAVIVGGGLGSMFVITICYLYRKSRDR